MPCTTFSRILPPPASPSSHAATIPAVASALPLEKALLGKLNVLLLGSRKTKVLSLPGESVLVSSPVALPGGCGGSATMPLASRCRPSRVPRWKAVYRRADQTSSKRRCIHFLVGHLSPEAQIVGFIIWCSSMKQFLLKIRIKTIKTCDIAVDPATPLASLVCSTQLREYRCGGSCKICKNQGSCHSCGSELVVT